MRLGIISDYDFYTDGGKVFYVNRGQRLLEHLCSRFDRVTYFARLMVVSDVSNLSPIRCNNFEVVPLRDAKRSPLLDAFVVGARLLRTQRSCDVFVIKLGNLHALVGFVLLKLLRRAVVCYAINDLDPGWHRFSRMSILQRLGHRALHYLWRIFYALADARLAISPTVARRYSFLWWGWDAHIYVETSLSPQCVRVRSSSVEGDMTVLSVGRLVHYKGHSFLIEAAAKLVHYEGLHFRLVIVGDGPLRRQLQDLVASLGLDDIVFFVGHVPQGPRLWQYYSSASIYVQPSLTEAFALAVLEAMYFGLPVVASAVGGLADLVKDGETGLLVRPGDVASLQNALGVLLRSPALRDRLGRSGRHIALRYSLETETDKLVDVVSHVMRKGWASRRSL